VIRLLLDENISPALIGKLSEQDVYAVAVPHVGLAGQQDHEIWKYALEHDFAVVTINARDFIRLLDVEIHPGLIVVREGGLTREEQWAYILPLIEHIRKSGDADFLVNKLVEVLAPGRWEVREIPNPQDLGPR
jgi:predicted nuclease of predicted toxin-antitoxin system